MQASSSLGVQAEHWVQASSMQQLQQAVRSIRQQQMELAPELQLVRPIPFITAVARALAPSSFSSVRY